MLNLLANIKFGCFTRNVHMTTVFIHILFATTLPIMLRWSYFRLSMTVASVRLTLSLGLLYSVHVYTCLLRNQCYETRQYPRRHFAYMALFCEEYCCEWQGCMTRHRSVALRKLIKALLFIQLHSLRSSSHCLFIKSSLRYTTWSTCYGM